MKKEQNTINLDSILFYSGDYANQAAEATANRQYGTYIEGLGYLRSTNDGGSYWTSYSNVVYREKTPTFNTLNDLFKETHSYLLNNDDYDYSIGEVNIESNRYTARYSYETTLDNLFLNSKIFPKNDLNDFLIGLNKQAFNKQNYYNGAPEISSIKFGYSYFDWITKETPAYFVGEGMKEATYSYSYMYFYYDDNDSNKYFPEEGEVIEPLINEESATSPYLHKFTYSYSYNYEYYDKGTPYYLDKDDYYSYFKHQYVPIIKNIEEYINSDLARFEEKYVSNPAESIYAYYMYDCYSDVPMQLNSHSLGLKNSTFKIRFDSEFDSWYTYYISLSANVNTNDTLYKITSGQDRAVFTVIDGESNKISDTDNIILNKNRSHEFISNVDLTTDNEIRILTPYKVDTLDLSALKGSLVETIDLNSEGWVENKGSMMKAFILGSESLASTVEKINGLNEITTLEYINLKNVNSLTVTPSLSNLVNLKVFEAAGSSIESFRPIKDSVLYKVSLPESIKSIKMMSTHFENGQLTVGGELMSFNGEFDYTPTKTLNSLVLSNIDNELSYKLYSDWYDACKSDMDDLLAFNYLELSNINWKDVPVEYLLALKYFDTNPDINGSIKLIGSGNYNWLTRDEYQNIIREFGTNAFENRALSNRVFKQLEIVPPRKTETFEFSLEVQNISAQKFNVAEQEYRDLLPEALLQQYLLQNYVNKNEKFIFTDTLPVSFGEFTEGNGSLIAGQEIYNRAANSFLDMVYHTDNKEKEFKFKVNRHANNIYCKLPNSLDTYYSKEISNIKAGDILLFNGDTIMIFFEDVVNSIYEYVKLGSLLNPVDSDHLSGIYSVKGFAGNDVSPLNHWFDSYACEIDETTGEEYIILKFIGSERKPVIQGLSLSCNGEGPDSNILYDDNTDGFLTITLNLPDSVLTEYDNIENTEIKFDISPNIRVEEISSDPTTYPRIFKVSPRTLPILSSDEYVIFYAAENREDTKVQIDIKLRNKYAPSTYDEETHTLILNGYHTIEDGVLIISSESIYSTVEDTTLITS